MKNELTFEIEKRNLQGLFSERNFELAEQLASRMLKDYNQFDYELLLKRASIKQCLMKYDEAMQDASLALQLVPDAPDAYRQLSDCLIATQRFSEARNVIKHLLLKEPENAQVRQQLAMLGNQIKNDEDPKFEYTKEHFRSLNEAVSGP